MKKTIIISASVIVIAAIAGGVVLYSRTNTDSIPTMSDSVDVVQNDVAEEPEQEAEQAPPVTEEEPEQTEETAPVETVQDDTEPEETDDVQEEPDTEPIDEALTDITELDKTMYAISAVNTRSGPSTEYERVGGLTTNEEVHVVGVSNVSGWFLLDIDGVTQFVSNNYLADTKVEVQQPQQQTTNQGNSENLSPEAQAFWDSIGGPSYFGDIPVGEKHGISDIDVSGITAE